MSIPSYAGRRVVPAADSPVSLRVSRPLKVGIRRERGISLAYSVPQRFSFFQQIVRLARTETERRVGRLTVRAGLQEHCRHRVVGLELKREHGEGLRIAGSRWWAPWGACARSKVSTASARSSSSQNDNIPRRSPGEMMRTIRARGSSVGRENIIILSRNALPSLSVTQPPGNPYAIKWESVRQLSSVSVPLPFGTKEEKQASTISASAGIRDKEEQPHPQLTPRHNTPSRPARGNNTCTPVWRLNRQ